jgi:hypothetical protein
VLPSSENGVVFASNGDIGEDDETLGWFREKLALDTMLYYVGPVPAHSVREARKGVLVRMVAARSDERRMRVPMIRILAQQS